MERRLIDEYEARVRELLAALTAERLPIAWRWRGVPHTMRGFGHVKLANVAIARAREGELLHRFDPERYPRPAGAAVAGQFRGIPVDVGLKPRGSGGRVGRPAPLPLRGGAVGRCYTFIDVHAAQDRHEVARPGSLALARPHAARLTRS